MKTALITGLVLLAGLPAAAQVDVPVCPYADMEVIGASDIPRLDRSCGYTVGTVKDNVAIVRREALSRPAVSPELLEIMRLDLERRQVELDRMERMRRERANRELGLLLLRQAFRQPVYVPPTHQPNIQDIHTQRLFQEYLQNELARQRRERLLGPYN